MDPIEINWTHDSGLRSSISAASLVVNWFHTLYYWPLGTQEMEESQLFLGMRRQLIPGTKDRFYGRTPEGSNIAYTGDAVDAEGIRVTSGPDARLHLVDEDQQTIFNRSFPAGGLVFQPGEPLPSGQGGSYAQMLALVDGEVVARCFRDGWCDPDYEPFGGRRGFLLYVAPKSWIELQTGEHHVEPHHRSRLSPLAV